MIPISQRKAMYQSKVSVDGNLQWEIAPLQAGGTDWEGALESFKTTGTIPFGWIIRNSDQIDGAMNHIHLPKITGQLQVMGWTGVSGWGVARLQVGTAAGGATGISQTLPFVMASSYLSATAASQKFKVPIKHNAAVVASWYGYFYATPSLPPININLNLTDDGFRNQIEAVDKLMVDGRF